MTEKPLLSVRNLEKHYPIRSGFLRRQTGAIRAVDGVNFDLYPGETLGIVGESGSGKSTTAMSTLRLEEPTAGSIQFDGEDVRSFGRRELRQFRRRAQLVLQDPNTAFNPRMTIGEVVAEPLLLHGIDDKGRRRSIVDDILERVGLGDADLDSYPHEFSGGEKQRISIARALVLNPDLIVADEPVSSLDSRRRDEILRLLGDLQDEFNLSILFISHDIDVVARFCDRVAVMYLGEIVERGDATAVVEEPQHPYTQTLVASVPSLVPGSEIESITRTDAGIDAADPPSGCRFHPRCPVVIPPESPRLSESEWQAVADLRFHLEFAFDDPEAVRELVELDRDGSSRDGTSFGQRLRETFNLEEALADETAESALADAVEAVANGDLQRARERLASTFETVCERDHPTPEVDGTQPVSCHRYDPELAVDPADPLTLEVVGDGGKPDDTDDLE